MAETKPSRRTVLLHGGVYTASRFLNQGVVFLLLPLYAHLLGTEGVGIVEVMVVARAFLSALLAQGLDSAWFRFRFGAEVEARRRLESTIVWYLVSSSVLGVAVLAAIGNWAAPVLTPGVPFFPLGFLTSIGAATLLLPSLFERSLQGDQRPLAFAGWSLFRTMVTTGTVVVFVAVLRRGAAGKIEAEALAGVALAVLSLILLAPKLLVSRDALTRALRYGLPLVPHSFAGLTNDLIDRFILSSLLGLSAVGVYSMGYRIAGIGMTLMVAVNQAFSPVFMSTLSRVDEHERRGETDEAKKLRMEVASVAFVNVVVGCLAAQGVAAAARELLLVATTPAFAESWRVVAPVSAGVVAWAWYGALSQSVAFRPDTVHRLPFITIAAALTNVAANYLLVPHLGIVGAAWATFISNATMAAGALLVGMRSLPLPYAFRKWALVSTWTLTSLAVLWYLDSAMAAPLPRTAAKAAWLSTSMVVTFVMSGVRIGTIRRFLARRNLAS